MTTVCKRKTFVANDGDWHVFSPNLVWFQPLVSEKYRSTKSPS